MIKDTSVEERDLDLIWSVYGRMLSSCSIRFSLAGFYQIGYICAITNERAEKKVRSS